MVAGLIIVILLGLLARETYGNYAQNKHSSLVLSALVLGLVSKHGPDKAAKLVLEYVERLPNDTGEWCLRRLCSFVGMPPDWIAQYGARDSSKEELARALAQNFAALTH